MIFGTIRRFAAQVRDQVMRDVVERISDGLVITAGALDDDTAVDGLVRPVIRNVYSAAAIDAQLYALGPSSYGSTLQAAPSP